MIVSRRELDPDSYREVRAGLSDLGAERDRCRGSHEIWRFADGEIFIVVCNHLGDRPTRKVAKALREVVARRSGS